MPVVTSMHHALLDQISVKINNINPLFQFLSQGLVSFQNERASLDLSWVMWLPVVISIGELLIIQVV